jgi:hypothetical protein
MNPGEVAVLDRALGAPDAAARPLFSDGRARLFVWSTWTAMFSTTLVLVVVNARNIPIYEDWQLVPAMTGHQGHFWSWLWEQNNEHRVPLPKLIYLALLKLWPDFRVGMVFSIVLLAVVAAAFIIVMQRLRGHTRWSDAFFPIVLLNLGHWENLGWSWELQFVVATALACGVLMGVASRRELTTAGALTLGVCLAAIPFTGATALPYAPLVAVALLPRLRRAPPVPRSILAASTVITLVVTVLYFVGLQRPYAPLPTPGPWATIETGAKSLALSAGPAVGEWWFVSSLVIIAVLAGAGVVLLRVRKSQGWLLLAFLTGGFALAVEVGYGRAAHIPVWGIPDRYALIAAPVLCCAYIAYDRYGSPTWRRLGPGLICGIVIVLLPLNVILGLQYRDWYHQLVDPYANEIKAGVLLSELAWYGQVSGYVHDVPDIVALHQARIGVFADLQVHGVTPPSTRIDGLDSDGQGWSTIGGPSSVALVEGSGAQKLLRWNYDVQGTSIPVLGRSFAAPQDWRGAGAMSITVVGQASGRTVDVRIATASLSGAIDRWDATFSDDVAGSRTVVLPLDNFAHVNSRGSYDLLGPLPRERVVAVILGVGGDGRGTLAIQRLGLEPADRKLVFRSWPETTRHSLPPWH